MNRKNHIFFDLDGTLVNTEKPIIYCLESAMRECGIPDLPYEIKLKFIGPPLLSSLMNYCNLSEDKAVAAYNTFRKYYSSEGVYMTEEFDGIADMVKSLYDSGKRLYTATSKPEKHARMILDSLGLSQYFTYIAGASLDDNRVTKIEVLRYALNTCGITDTSDCVMIGDRCFDAEGAALANMDCIGVLWGFGGKEELTAAGCIEICSNPLELTDILCK